jgi:type I restriction enzyme R subunit
MENGVKTDMGDRLGKTIVFARNHNHAIFIEERFNANYPHYRGHFARVIDNYAKYPDSLIEEFSDKESELRMAISVDMLDTGIDVPEVVNLVFFKPIHSKIKFLQMMGRGTRLCPDLFGPGMDKEHFLVLDFCENLEYFAQNPEGAGGSAAEPLPKRLFKARLELLQGLSKQESSEREANDGLRTSLAKTLGDEVRGMNLENFIVKLKRETVGRFQEGGKDWERLSSADCAELEREVAGLPSELEMDGVEARLFDLKILRLQVCLVEENGPGFDKLRLGVMEVAGQLSEMPEVPQVAAILSFLGELQEDDWWTDATPAMLETVRKKLRGLVRLIEKAKQAVIYTNFEDEMGEVIEVEETQAAYGGINLGRFRQKTTEFLRARENDLVIQKLRHREALTEGDLEELQKVLVEQGGDKGEDLLSQLLSEQGQNVAEFARSIVGLDRQAAIVPFARFLDQANFNARQIRFVEMIVDFVTRNGKLEAKQLYETPFTDDGSVESIFPNEEDADAIFELVQEVSRVKLG